VNATVVGMGVGAVLAIVGVTVGFWALVLVAVCMAIGAVVARLITGEIDVRRLADVLRGRRSSS
jgi:uncharacterized membrane protein